jgi:hypothetical protein
MKTDPRDKISIFTLTSTGVIKSRILNSVVHLPLMGKQIFLWSNSKEEKT